MWMCKLLFKDATKIQNNRQKSTPKCFVGAKTLKLKFVNYSNFTITLTTIWRCACDFFKVLLKFKIKWPPCINFIIFCGRKKSKKIIRNNVQVILLKFKWPSQVDFLNICDRKNSNLINGGG